MEKFSQPPAYCEEVITVYLAKGLTFSKQKLDEGEFLKIEKVPLEKLLEMVMAGKLPDCKTQIAVLKQLFWRGCFKNENSFFLLFLKGKIEYNKCS